MLESFLVALEQFQSRIAQKKELAMEFLIVFVIALVIGSVAGIIKLEPSDFQSLVIFCVVFLLIMQTCSFCFGFSELNHLREQLQKLIEKAEEKGE